MADLFGIGSAIGSAIQAKSNEKMNFLNSLKDVGMTAWQYKHDSDILNKQQDFNALEAQKQRDYEERMSNTAYQRAIADMEAAGINPASITGTSGASTPSGATATSSGYSRGGYNTPLKAGDLSIMSSAINGMLAKDRDAAKYLADEFRDNARHAHKMEEIREWKAEKKALSSDDPNAGFEVL